MDDEMTVPHLMNCPHSSDGWCLPCIESRHQLFVAMLELCAGAMQAADEKIQNSAYMSACSHLEEGLLILKNHGILVPLKYSKQAAEIRAAAWKEMQNGLPENEG